MKCPLQIRSRHFPLSQWIETLIVEKVSKLDQIHHRLTSCRVLVETPQRRRHQGNLHHVQIDLTAPGAELVASGFDEDIDAAVRDAFGTAARRLEDYARRRRGERRVRQKEERLSSEWSPGGM